jgi:hypothetical protein
VLEALGDDFRAKISDVGWSIALIDSLSLPAQETVTFWAETEQLRHRDDREVFVATFPLENPEIEIVIPPDFDYDIGTHHRERLVEREPHIYRLHGTLLPYQGINLRWWPKNSGPD